MLLIVLQTLGNDYGKSRIESRSRLCRIGCLIRIFGIVDYSFRVSSGRPVLCVVSVVLNPCRNDCYIVCGHGLGKLRIPTVKGLMLLCGIGKLKSCAIVNHGLYAVNSKLVLVTGKVDFQYEAAVRCDFAADNIVCRLVEGEAFGGSCICIDRSAGGAVKGLSLSCAVVAVDIHRVSLDGVGNAGRLFELGVEGNILYAHLADFLIPALEDIAFLGGICGSDNLLADLRSNGCMNSAVNIEGSGVGHKLESCDCVVDSLGGCVNNTLLGVLLAGDIVSKSFCKSSSGLGSVLSVVALFALLSLSRCDCRVVGGVVGIVLAPLGNEGQVLCGHGGGNLNIPAGEGVALSGSRIGYLESCTEVNIGLYAVNRKLILVTAVVDLENKAAVSCDCAGKDAVLIVNRESLAGVRCDGDGFACGCGNSLNRCRAVSAVDIHFVSLNLVGDCACGELSVEGNILKAHNTNLGIPTGEDIAFLGGLFGKSNLLADLRLNGCMNSAVNIEYRVVGHQLESCNCIVDSLGGCINNTLLGIKLAGDILSESFRESISARLGVSCCVAILGLLRLSRCDCRVVSGVVSAVLCPLGNDCYIVCGHGLGKLRFPTCEGVVLLDGVCYGNSRAIVEGMRNAFSGKGVLVTTVEYLEDKRTVSGDSAGKDALRGIEREALCGNCVGGYVGGRTGLAGTLIGAVGS